MKIAVYCGSGLGNTPCIRELADQLGKWLAAQGHTLVFGGGNAGLMGIVAKAAFEGGASVIGVLPANVDFIVNRPQPYSTKTILAADMSARKQTMAELADAFFALPGGMGTLDEITEVMTLTGIHVFHKPCILIDAGHYYKPLEQMLTSMVAHGFLPEEQLKHYLFSEDLEEIQAFLEQYQADTP